MKPCPYCQVDMRLSNRFNSIWHLECTSCQIQTIYYNDELQSTDLKTTINGNKYLLRLKYIVRYSELYQIVPNQFDGFSFKLLHSFNYILHASPNNINSKINTFLVFQ